MQIGCQEGYGHVDWDFFDGSYGQDGISKKVDQLGKLIYLLKSFSVLVNGTPTRFFFPIQGA